MNNSTNLDKFFDWQGEASSYFSRQGEIKFRWMRDGHIIDLQWNACERLFPSNGDRGDPIRE
jgi:hypothetical protein